MLNRIQTTRKTQLRICDAVVSDTGVRIPCIQGQTSQVDLVSQNGYRYRRGFWDKVIGDEAVQAVIAARDMLGTVEHPEDDKSYLRTPYELASHIVLKAWVDKSGNPWAQFGLLNNPHGNAIKALVDLGHQPGVSTRGLGEYGNDDISQYVCDDNYALLGWDIVRTPNFSELKMDKVSDSLRSMPLFQEVVQMYHIRDTVDAPGITRETILKEIKDAMGELQKKYDLLMSLEHAN